MEVDKALIKELQSRITSIEDVPVTAKVVLYSDPGVGKTTAAALSPKPLFINCEGGTLSLNKFKKFHKQLDIKTIRAETLEDLKNLFWYLKSGDHDRQTVILDSLTEIQQISMQEILADPRRDAKHDKDTPMLADYAKNTSQLRKIVRAFRDLPMNVVFTCLSAESKDDSDGSVQVRPNLTPKLASDVMGYVDVVGYMFVADVGERKGIRKLLTQPKGKYLAKDRSGTLGLGMEEPTMFEVFHRITSGKIEVPKNINEIIEEVKRYES